MRILIVEDEPLAAERLAQLILEYESHIQVVATLDSVRGTVKWLQEHPEPDLVFMDIELADGLSFNIFEQQRLQAPVIFTTAYDEYAIRAFKVNSVDYLLKPLSAEDVAQAIDKYVRLFTRPEPALAPVNLQTIKALLEDMHQPQVYKQRFVVRQGERLFSIPVQEILYFYAEEKLTFLKTRAGKRHIVEETLGELEARLDPQAFFRLNRQYLVCHDAIQEIIAHSHSRLKVLLPFTEDDQIIVSKNKVGDFKTWLDA